MVFNVGRVVNDRRKELEKSLEVDLGELVRNEFDIANGY